MQGFGRAPGSRPPGAALAPRGWLSRLVIWAMVAGLWACGGGSDAPGPAAPPPGAGPGPAPAPAVVSFQLLPARLSLAVGGAGALLPVQAPGALTWSSSDPAVASVDAQGQVTALAAGSTEIVATSGASITSATVKVYPVSAPSPTKLIALALAQNRISAEQALSYRVFALFGDQRLPLEFEGAPDAAPDHMLMRQVAAALPTLSPATKDLLLPFVLPPIYANSWFGDRLGLPAAAAAGGRAAATSVAAERASTVTRTTINCDAVTHAPYWKRLATAHFNIHYIALSGDTEESHASKGAAMIAAVVEEVYQAETGLLQRFPLSDVAEPCNGGDGAVDIYLASIGGPKLAGLAQSYPDRCNNVPSFIAINSNHAAMLAAAVGHPDARSGVKAIVAHEVAHVLQLAMDRQGGPCKDYEWFDEASAEWIMDFVEPTANREDGFEKVSDERRRSGSHFAQYLFSDHLAPIEQPGGRGDSVGYADYIFFQYLARKHGAQVIKQAYDASVTLASVEAVQSALAAQGGMKAVWPEFALTVWNDSLNHVLDDFNQWDGYDYGLAAIYQRQVATNPSYGLGPEPFISLEVNQQGQPRATFKLLKNALEPPGEFPRDSYEIPPRSLIVEHLKFSDATVHSVYFSNPIAAFPNREFMKLQVKKKIDGQWQAVEDWTAEPFKQFCLDKKDERLEELLLIVSNSEVNRGAEQPFRIPKDFPMIVSTSNVGCWMWQGSAQTTLIGGTPSPIDSVARGVNLVLVVQSVMPGRVIFGTSFGTVSGDSTVTLGPGCTNTAAGASKELLVGMGGWFLAGDDGKIDINLDLDLGFTQLGGESPDRKLIQLSGFSFLSTTNSMVCPPINQTTVGSQGWEWLHVDEPTLYTVSADGQVIEGRFTAVLPGGATIDSQWKFTALRQ